MDLEPLILSELRTAGPWTAEHLASELTYRAESKLLPGVTGFVSVGAVLTCLNALRAKGRAELTDDGWDWKPERQPIAVVPSGRTKQVSMF